MATPTPVDLSSFTAEQKKLFAGANALGTGVQTYNSANPGATLNANTLQGSPSLTTPPVSTPVTPPAAPPVNFGVQQAQTDYDSTLKDLEAALGQSGQVTARTQQLENQAGIPQLDSRLNELYGLDAGYVADLSSIASQQLQGTAAQQGTATSEAGRRVDLKDLNYNAVIAQQNVNIKRATNNAVIASVQGQLANAQQNVQRALELEFKPLEAKIDYLKEFARINAGRLSDKENAQLQYQITQQTRAYEESVGNKKAIYSLMLEAANKGAPPAVLAQIQTAKTPEEAMQYAGSYFAPQNTFKQASDANGNLVEYEVDPQGKVIGTRVLSRKAAPVSGGGAGGTAPAPAAQAQKIEALTLARELRSDSATGKKEAIGASPAKFFDTITFGGLGKAGLQPNRTAFEAKVNTLKAQLTFENLSLLKGAMSDKDLLFLTAIGSSLDTNMNESEFNKELDRVIGKLETASGVSTAPSNGATKVWEGKTYKVVNGMWVQQ